MIPKIIHYCWFGPKEKDALTQACIDSWHHFLPDYTFKEWTDKDLVKLEGHRYVYQAYHAKKYAFVSDVFRLYALYTEGGIYFDTDVEVKKSFNPLLDLDFFIGSEIYGNVKQIGTAVIGSEKKSPIIERLLHMYNDITFVGDTGYDMTPNTIRLIEPLKKCGFNEVYAENNPIYNGYKQVIFPCDFFSKESTNSFTVHHFVSSWVDDFKCQYLKRIHVFDHILGFYKFKKIKQNGVFLYPDTMKYKLAEFNYGNRHKILLTIEREKYEI